MTTGAPIITIVDIPIEEPQKKEPQVPAIAPSKPEPVKEPV